MPGKARSAPGKSWKRTDRFGVFKHTAAQIVDLSLEIRSRTRLIEAPLFERISSRKSMTHTLNRDRRGSG
jgi:hypothetical protein